MLHRIRIDEVPEHRDSIWGNTPELDRRVVIPYARRRLPFQEKGHATLCEDRRPPPVRQLTLPRVGEHLVAIVAPPGRGERFYTALVWCTAEEFDRLEASLAQQAT